MLNLTDTARGILHRYKDNLVAFEHFTAAREIAYNGNGSGKDSYDNINFLIYIGGLGDNILGRYTNALSNFLPANWVLVEIQLGSCLQGWATSSVHNDVNDISDLLEYLKGLSRPQNSSNKSKFVLLGHSTGCQDIMAYLTTVGDSCTEKSTLALNQSDDVREKNHVTKFKDDWFKDLNRPWIDGAILQAPVSDREHFVKITPKEVFETICKAAQELIKAGSGQNVISEALTRQANINHPISAYRWWSLACPTGKGDEDYFSSDLPDCQLISTFGKLPDDVFFMALHSEMDEYVPEGVDKAKILSRWSSIVKQYSKARWDDENSGILPMANHSLIDETETERSVEVIKNFSNRVRSFLEKIEKQ